VPSETTATRHTAPLLDVEQRLTRLLERNVSTDPEVITRLFRTKAPRVNRVGLETGQLSVWLCHELRRLGLPVGCMDARQAHAALSVLPNATLS
jgi:transposase